MAVLDLSKLEKQKISTDIKGKFMLFYGLPGIGKTALASQFPNVLICGFEQGTNGLDDNYVVPIQRWADWKAYVGQLTRKKEVRERYDTIAIDTADSAWDQCARYICDNNGINELSELEWGAGHAMAKKEFKSTLESLTFAGYTVIFISHSVDKELKDSNGNKYLQTQPALSAAPYGVINKMVDITGYIRAVEKQDGTTQRYIFFREDKHYFAKSRFEYIVPYVEFSYDNIVNAIKDAILKKAEASRGKGADVSNDANPYTQKTFDDLIDEAKVVWIKIADAGKTEEAAKILEEEFGKPTKFSEILPEQIDKLKVALSRVEDLV